MTDTVNSYGVVTGSELGTDGTIYGLARYSGPANPVGNLAGPTRETAPLAVNASPRVQHPKLNTKPWSTSYAQHRPAAKERKGTGRRGYNEGKPQ